MNNSTKDVFIVALLVVLISSTFTTYETQGPEGVELMLTGFVDHILEFWLPALAALGLVSILLHLNGGSEGEL